MSERYVGAQLDLVDLTKRYRSTTALDDFNLKVESGEFVSLLGPSGSGKSTILNLISGYQSPDNGNVCIDGKDVASLPPAERDIGIVFQQYALFPHMNVEQNVAYGLKRRKWSRERVNRRVAEMLELVGLAGMNKRRPDQLSGGQQQRVALARALAFEPRILLMDEPLAALDREIRVQLRGEIRRIHQELKPTVVYVTHDRDEAFALSDRVVILKNGGIERVGTPTGIYDDPRTAFVSTFYCGFQRLPGVQISATAPDHLQVEWLGQRGVVPIAKRLPAPCSIVVSPADIHLTPGSAGRVVDVVMMGGTAIIRTEVGEDRIPVSTEISAREAHQFRVGDGVDVIPEWPRAFAVEDPNGVTVDAPGDDARRASL